MQILEMLWKLIRMYFSYRQGRKAGQGRAGSADAMTKAYMKGDYQTAFFRAADPFFKGLMSLEMGQFGAALPLIQFAASTASDPRTGAMANNLLGRLRMEEGQHDQALECFRTAQILWQERGGADRWIAELWLRRGENLKEALRLARRGLEKERAHPGFTEDTKNASLCEQLGTLAWAVGAECHDAEEAGRLVTEGLGITARVPVASIAQMHLHFGQAYNVLGDAEKSGRHFDEAARIDPNGLAGRAAASMLVPTRA